MRLCLEFSSTSRPCMRDAFIIWCGLAPRMFSLLQKHGMAMLSSTCNPSLLATGHDTTSDVSGCLSHIPWWTQPAAECHKPAASCRPVTCCCPPSPTQRTQDTTSCSSTQAGQHKACLKTLSVQVASATGVLSATEIAAGTAMADANHQLHCLTHQDPLPQGRTVTPPLHCQSTANTNTNTNIAAVDQVGN